MTSLLKLEVAWPDESSYPCEFYSKQAAKNILDHITANFHRPSTHGVFGVMAGGKSDVLAHLSRELEAQGISCQILKLAGDERAGNLDTVYCRNGNFPALPVSSAAEIEELLLGAEVTLIDEAPFILNPKETIELTELVRASAGHLVYTGLGAWFNGELVPGAAAFVRSGPDTLHVLQARCSFDPSRPADYTLRGVGVDLATGKMIHTDAHCGPYVTLNPVERIRFAQDYLANLEPTMQQVLSCRELAGQEFPEGLVFLPSHPKDPLFAIGADRYFPVSAAKAHELYIMAGMNELTAPGIINAYNQINRSY